MCEQTLNIPGRFLIRSPNDACAQTHTRRTPSSTTAGGKNKKRKRSISRYGNLNTNPIGVSKALENDASPTKHSENETFQDAPSFQVQKKKKRKTGRIWLKINQIKTQQVDEFKVHFGRSGLPYSQLVSTRKGSHFAVKNKINSPLEPRNTVKKEAHQYQQKKADKHHKHTADGVLEELQYKTGSHSCYERRTNS